MNEKKLIKNQLIKNMLYSFIVFAIILIFFDAIIYNQVSISLYKSIDEELKTSAQMYSSKTQKNFIQVIDKPKEIQIGEASKPDQNENKFMEFKVNPRLVCIIRNSNGEIQNSSNIGRFYEDYLEDLKFNKSELDKIYEIKVQNSYTYRGITVKKVIDGEEVYIQFLANVDGEVETTKNVTDTLLYGSIIIIVVAIISSYILSKITLKPIMESYRKQTEFVQNAAHELRTPLTIVQAKQELLLQEPNSKIIDKSEDINIILKETKRLTKLIKELMTLAMADSNELKMDKQKTNIDNLIKEVIVPYIEYAQIQEKEINLNLNYGKEINIDRNKISELLIIVLDNAIKYTKENDKITIKTYQKDGKFELEVQDTGIGISLDAAKQVFNRFYREDKARSRETGGTGLRTFDSTYYSKASRRKHKNNSKRTKRNKSNNKIVKLN
ncbi:MAG: sensor histidine kinase [Clostridia bacterium]|nr:sensor histidine kinase [Clostridia bacterium]